ncbi:MAG: 4-alpha-glucanotransferase [Chlamydiia bacterium]|nr:4-alpha-glucanotransferase [Chlamydiia bacterium]
MEEITEEDIYSRIKEGPIHEAWHRIGIKHHHGINIPLFSIHSENSCGVGEFLDLKLLIEFCASVNMGIIQLLPLNDAGYETSPYNAVSSQALGPIYISIRSLPFVKSDEDLLLDLAGFKRYTYLQKVAYNAVLAAKLEFLRKYYYKYFDNFSKTLTYQAFLKDNPWLHDYGLFKALKDDYAHRGWFSWEKKHQDISKSYKKQLLKEKETEINFYIFLQFLCFTQMEEVKGYAQKKGVMLKGDIPILISPESLDVWHARENFDLDYSAGAPPDIFTPTGQCWGFPIYDWKHIEETKYSFWENRLKTAGCFYHMYRIDHIIGLYRIFAITRGKGPEAGVMIPEDPSLALRQGEHILRKFSSITKMFPIGEDLGADIEYIRESLAKQAVPGTKIPRWERDHLGDKAFIKYEDYNPFSVTTVSTHDSETLSLWWENNAEEVRHFTTAQGMKYTKHLTQELRFQMLKDSHHTNSLFHINLLSEYLALFKDLVWENPHDERINLPGTVLPSNWCYRLRPSLEMLLEHNDLKDSMKNCLPKK